MNFAIAGYLYVVFFAIACLVDYLPFIPLIKTISSLSMGSMHTIRSDDISDTEKEKLLLKNSLQLFQQSLKLLGFVVLIAICGFILLFVSRLFKSLNYAVLLNYMVTLYGLLLSVIAFFSYFLVKKLYVKVRL
ncbi:MAG TPA: hypothetical protein VNW95_08650 [Mucilaginibacter sp.]|jgi:hypothetical protein|nr:hypothetical protein [Mucilaginibacter sp.]